MKKRRVKLFITLLLLLAFAGCTFKPSGNTPVTSSGEGESTSLTQGSTVTPIALNIKDISFDLKGFPGYFKIGIGEYNSGFYSPEKQNVTIDEICSSNIPKDIDGFWIVSPFYEPLKALFKDVPNGSPVDLASLTKGIKYKEINIKAIDTKIKQIGPFPWYGSPGERMGPLYSLNNDKSIIIYPGPKGIGIADLNSNKTYLNGSVYNLNAASYAVSPDNKKIAYISYNTLYIENLSGEDKISIELGKKPELENGNPGELLSFSPDSKYVLCSFQPMKETKISKLFVVNVEKGNTVNFKIDSTHVYSNPVWSPDGSQVVLEEYCTPYTEIYDSKWILLDIKSGTIKDIIERTQKPIICSFSWDRSGKISVASSVTNDIFIIDSSGREQNGVINGEHAQIEFIASDIQFLKNDGQNDYKLNIQNAVKQTGLDMNKVISLCFFPSWSPDKKYLYLEGNIIEKADDGPGINKVIYGSVDIQAKKVSFIPEIFNWDKGNLETFQNNFISDDKVIIYYKKNCLSVFDMKNMKIIELLNVDKLIKAGIIGNTVLCVTENKAFTVDMSGKVKNILNAGKDEKFIYPVYMSADEGRITVAKYKKNKDALCDITIYVVEIK